MFPFCGGMCYNLQVDGGCISLGCRSFTDDCLLLSVYTQTLRILPKMSHAELVWWNMSVVPRFKRQRQEDLEFSLALAI